ncbi:MAG TPA: S-layer homology domain-containing protein, partial [Chloroflexia bacterium]|nr:S-layer homology domain-containing protein [Chloroflexia bacterium]
MRWTIAVIVIVACLELWIWAPGSRSAPPPPTGRAQGASHAVLGPGGATATSTATAGPLASDTPSPALTATASPAGTAAPPTATRVPAGATRTPVLPTATVTPYPTFPPCASDWQLVSVPDVGPLSDVSVSSPTDVWAVGRAQVLHWDGQTWAVTTPPSPNSYWVSLAAIYAAGPGRAWVVGSYSRWGGSASNALVEYWNGSSWTVLCCSYPAGAAPGGGGEPYAAFSAVVPDGPGSIRAYGGFELDYPPPYHHEYTTTCTTTACGGGLVGGGNLYWARGGAVGSATWVVGSLLDELTHDFQPQVNGAVITPNIGMLVDVSGVSPADAWTLSSRTILHRDATGWQVAYTTGTHVLHGVQAVSATDAWAVGDTILHWNGTTWTEVPHLPFDLHAVDGTGPADLWVVSERPDYPFASIVEHYTGACQTLTPAPPTPTPAASPTPCSLGTFSDVHPADYFYTPVSYLATHYIVSGYSDCTFRPYSDTTRAQTVKIAVNGFALPVITPLAGGYSFADVLPAHPFFVYIETARGHAVISGYTCGGPGEPCDAQSRPYFRPYANVTRGQLTKIIGNAAGWPAE